MDTQEKILKFKKASAKFVHDYLVRSYAHDLDGWDSSAERLEKKLKKRGVKLPCKLYCEYNFPGNQKNFEFDKTTSVIRAFISVYENYLKMVQNVPQKKDLKHSAERPAITDLCAFFGFCICLALSDTKDILSLFNQTYMLCKIQLYEIAEQIWQLNPELQHIKDYRNLDFVNGAIYGFAPEEIDFFVKLQERRKNRIWDYERLGKDEQVNHVKENWRKIAFFTLEHPGYFLSPETADKIVHAIQKYEKEHPRSKIMEMYAIHKIKKMYG